jgi:hypothetical protein
MAVVVGNYVLDLADSANGFAEPNSAELDFDSANDFAEQDSDSANGFAEQDSD